MKLDIEGIREWCLQPGMFYEGLHTNCFSDEVRSDVEKRGEGSPIVHPRIIEEAIEVAAAFQRETAKGPFDVHLLITFREEMTSAQDFFTAAELQNLVDVMPPEIFFVCGGSLVTSASLEWAVRTDFQDSFEEVTNCSSVIRRVPSDEGDGRVVFQQLLYVKTDRNRSSGDVHTVR